MSHMPQPKTRKRTKSTSVAINFRVRPELKRALTEIASLDSRRLNDYLVLHLERHVKECTVDEHGLPHPVDPPLRQLRSAPVTSAGGSEPPQRIKDMAKAKTPAPPEKLAEIADSDEGWEGSNPRTLLGGTKA